MSQGKSFRIAVLFSGGGGLMMRLIRAASEGEVAFVVSKVIASRPDAAGLAKARAAHVPAAVVPRMPGDADQDYSQQVWKAVATNGGVDAVMMLGWLPRLGIPPQWSERVVNAHPSLLPLFGGKGMWGRHVHRAVLASGMRVAGCTFHFASNEYDDGPILHQSAVPVLDTDTEETLEARVIEAQHRVLIPFVNAWARGDIQRYAGRFVGGPTSSWYGGESIC